MRFTFPGDRANLIFDNVNNKGGLSLDTGRGIVTGFSDVKSGLSVGATRLFVYAASTPRSPAAAGSRAGAARTSPAVCASSPGRTAP